MKNINSTRTLFEIYRVPPTFFPTSKFKKCTWITLKKGCPMKCHFDALPCANLLLDDLKFSSSIESDTYCEPLWAKKK